jgi:ADP-ribose pyrophosphatase
MMINVFVKIYEAKQILEAKMEKYFKDMDYEKISEEEAFNGKRVKVKIEKYYNKRDNKEVYREHIKAGNGAVIMPFLDDNTLIMIEEIRTPIGKSILAFPAGLIEKGEDPATAAKRELEEETGYSAGEIEQIIYEYPAVGYSDEKVYIFKAKNLTKTQRHLDPTEDIKVHKISVDELKELYRNGEIHSSAELIAILSYFSKI